MVLSDLSRRFPATLPRRECRHSIRVQIQANSTEFVQKNVRSHHKDSKPRSCQTRCLSQNPLNRPAVSSDGLDPSAGSIGILTRDAFRSAIGSCVPADTYLPRHDTTSPSLILRLLYAARQKGRVHISVRGVPRYCWFLSMTDHSERRHTAVGVDLTPITNLSRVTPATELIWKRAVLGHVVEDSVRSPLHVVYSVVPFGSVSWGRRHRWCSELTWL